jgi:formamidopyrimidine-DNA glycosylase
MPELPDITVYLEALETRVLGRRLEQMRVRNPFLLRTVSPPLATIEGRVVTSLQRIGKRIAFGFQGDYWLVLHLMIAGRLHWIVPGSKPARKQNAAVFQFPDGTLVLTEAGTRKRASLHLVHGSDALQEMDPGGIEITSCSEQKFASVLRSESHTLKRALTDPGLFSGIGNAYSDEILHAAQLSPVALTPKLSAEQIIRLYRATKEVLQKWVKILRDQAGNDFPEKVTAFRPEMAVHGKFGHACPTCGSKVQRIRYAENETDYCPTCQTGGRLLADRSLSLLLKKDWPKTAEELEEMRSARALPRAGAKTN